MRRIVLVLAVGALVGAAPAWGADITLSADHRIARYDDVVRIETELVELGRASLSFDYQISREGEGCILATGSTKHACIDGSGRVARIPRILTDAINAASR